MSKNYDAYFPKQQKTKLVQAKVAENLHEQCLEVLAKKNLSWTDFLTSLMQKYLDDNKRRAG